MTKRSPHPYLSQPARAFWSRSVARGWSPENLVVNRTPLLRHTDRIASAGSCFAANIVPFFEAVGYDYIRTEIVENDDKFGYSLYSAAYGNIYTPRQLYQLLLRVLGRFTPSESRWHLGDAVIDPFRPGLSDPATTEEEFELLTFSHLNRVRAAIELASVFIFTLGLTEAWTSRLDGAVFPSCPGTIAGVFDPSLHEFKNFSVYETTEDLRLAVSILREINPSIRIILTVSPVPLVATATTEHVYRATTYSKSVLRVACEEVSQDLPEVIYFPAYEIVTGPNSDGFFEADRRSVSQAGIQTVINVLLKHSELPPAGADNKLSLIERIRQGEELSKKLSERECEEVANDANETKV